MLITKKVIMRWNNKNKKYYTEKGYHYTFINDEFEVDVSDLSKGSHCKVEVMCDYCLDGKIQKEYRIYLKQNEKSIIKKDCCEKCKSLKTAESNSLVYGVVNVFQTEVVKDKTKKTLMSKYGIENPSQMDDYREKFTQTSLKRYGVPHPFQSQIVKDKIIKTTIKRYGYKVAIQNPKIKEKAIKTLYKNGNAPVSSEQLKIFEMLSDEGFDVVLNYPYKNFNFDVAIFKDDIKIDLEYDCWYWHKNRLQIDRRRDEISKQDGWKIIRIKSAKLLPTIEELKVEIEKIINTDRMFTQIVLDDWGDKEVS